ncbi:MAG: UxaA family hydrolase [Dethiobacteria bacterium]
MAVLKINEKDNVAVALAALKRGQTIEFAGGAIAPLEDIAAGHKIALKDIGQAEEVIKYGFPIGRAKRRIRAGCWVHEHNLETGLGPIMQYEYRPVPVKLEIRDSGKTFSGYRRQNGQVGVRNEIWIIPTVSCVNRIAELIAERARREIKGLENIDGIYEFKHPYGCSQTGEDQLATQKLLAGLVNHPNAAAVLVIGLGCENNHVEAFQEVLGDYDGDRVKFMVAQEVEDEIAAGRALVDRLLSYARQFKRTPCPVSALVAGLKCGGSDGFSGITANPLAGVFSDMLVSHGGSTILTEVPEMFGAETLLMERALNRDVFEKIVRLINDFKEYYISYGQPVYENPSPGNRRGGITTLEEKSLGCTQKGGSSAVVDVLDYGERISKKGLNLLSAPGNDMVAGTALAAAGCQLILFTTGRGTPLGTCVPTVKIATNSTLYRNKPQWIDFNAGQLLEGETMPELAAELWDYVMEVASGQLTGSEKMGFREIAIFKSGVTL